MARMKIFGDRKSHLTLCFALVSALLLGCHSIPNSLATHDSSKWTKEINAFAAADQTNRPPPGSIVFVGSSSIRIWQTLQTDFPGLPVVNRGFGGSQLADSVNFADQLILQHHPREVVIYAGSNDINAGKEPEVVFGDFVALASKIHQALPKTKIAFISIGPSPSRWGQVEKVKRTNEMIRHYAQRHGIDFIDVFPLMLGPDGLPNPDIYRADKLHMNDKGYRIWVAAVRPHLIDR
jgi:lysophospholipase L1-like esterase